MTSGKRQETGEGAGGDEKRHKTIEDSNDDTVGTTNRTPKETKYLRPPQQGRVYPRVGSEYQVTSLPTPSKQPEKENSKET